MCNTLLEAAAVVAATGIAGFGIGLGVFWAKGKA